MVPSLHVLCHKLQSTGNAPHTEELATVREDLIKWIADEALGGDEDAAQWLLLELSAKVSVLPYLSNEFASYQIQLHSDHAPPTSVPHFITFSFTHTVITRTTYPSPCTF